MRNLGGWEWVIILLVVLLLFGARRLPDLARSVGKSARIFRSEVKDLGTPDAPPADPANSPLETTTDDDGERGRP